MFLLAARTLADAVSPERLASGALYPPVDALRGVSRTIAVVVATEAVRAGLAGIADADGRPPDDAAIAAAVDGAMWWPDYVPYTPARVPERRRETEI